MSVENPLSINGWWRIDPDNRQDRSSGPCITRKMTDEEMKKYGVVKEDIMSRKLEVDENRMLEVCREFGTGKEAAEVLAEEFGLTSKQVFGLISNRGIKKALKAEKEEKLKAADELLSKVASHESHPDIVEALKKEITTAAEVDEMMEMVPDNINHPAHYTSGRVEVIDYLQDKLTEEGFEGFCIGNALKYLSRYRLKGGIEDLKKARRYLEIIIDAKRVG